MSNKLLLADDSITIRKVVGIIFANEDYSLSVVDNGIAALETAREIIPDIILADVLMPGKTGYEVCEEIRRDPALSHLPLLLLTGAFEPFDEEKARLSGADDFISKPFESQQLIEKVRSLIELGRERKSAGAILEPEVAAEPAPPPPSLAAIDEEIEFAVPRPEEVLKEPAFEEPAFLLEDITSGEETVEALPEDDLWGAFELEEVVEEEPAALEAVPEKEIVDPFAELEALDEFTLGEERRPVPPVIPPEAAAEPAEETAKPWQPAEEETFTLGEEDEPAGFEPEPEEELFTLSDAEEPVAAEPVSGDVFVLGEETEELPVAAAFAAPPAEAAPAAQDVELQFAPEEEYVPVLTPAAPPAPSLTPAPAAAQPAVGGEVALSDEQLAAIVSKISRDIIEKIAWEVVPDLAEMLIREEIRKLKKGLSD
jgi:CheY-like chemotaxis protein